MVDLVVKRMTVKLGTNVVSAADGSVNWQVLTAVVNDIVQVKRTGKEVLLVSSGAIGLGRKKLPARKKDDLAFRQACAAVGQTILMNTYQELFGRHGLTVAQILVTADDLADRRRYLNLREMLGELLRLDVVPIINENDSVSTMELRPVGKDKVFGDNDKLSALVASKLGSDLLVLLTDVDGVYEANPRYSAEARRIPLIRDIGQFERLDLSGKSSGGRGGMAAKLAAARLASLSGLYTLIANGGKPGVVAKAAELSDVEKTDIEGTVVCPTQGMRGRTHWIGFSSGIEGVLVVNHGAQAALEEKKASLLPVGVTAVQGSFRKGDVVSIRNPEGIEVARGITEYSSVDAGAIIGCQSKQITEKFGEGAPTELVHRNRMAVFQERSEG